MLIWQHRPAHHRFRFADECPTRLGAGSPWPDAGTEWYVSTESTESPPLLRGRALASEFSFRWQHVGCGGSGTTAD
jgi:hypothetical protein